MEIEIITTKKKLTKSIINQMHMAGIGAMNFATSFSPEITHKYILGLLVGCRKGCHEVILLKNVNDYSVLRVEPWEKTEGSPSIEYYTGRATRLKKFKTFELRDQWFDLYQKCVKFGKKNHIYI